MKKCIICGHIKLLNNDLSLFQAPSNANRLHEWSSVTGTLITKKHFVCMKHFEEKFIITSEHDGTVVRRTLKSNAVPTLHLGCGSKTIIRNENMSPAPPSPKLYQFPIKQYLKRKIIYDENVPTKRYEDISQIIQIPEALQIQPVDSEPFLPNLPQNSQNDNNLVERASQQTQFFDLLKQNLTTLNSLLPTAWGVHESKNVITISHMNNTIPPQIDKAIVVGKTDLQVFVNAISRAPIMTPVNLEDFLKIVKTIDTINVCNGTGLEKRVSQFCNGENNRSNSNRCYACAKLRKQLLDKTKKANETKTKSTIQRKQAKKQYYYLRKKQLRQAKTIEYLQKKMAKIQNIDELISKLPENQKIVVRTCFESAGRHSTGRRYSKDWLYTCILMKIKSPKLYKHLRTRKLLPLPAPSTLSKYIRNIDSSYGFQNKLFELLKEKTKNMSVIERHGTLMVDECKITPSKHFDKNRLEVVGFVDLGEYTPENQKDQLGDHALVIMFQSFAGKNMQALACFLSKGNVSGSVQAKLILEAVLLSEAAGLFVDVVTSDGATWNRSMWKSFGVENSDEPWCIHPCDQQRKLRMCSDFPHLIKCIRNRLVAKKEFHVPEGCVRLEYFEKLMEYDAKHEFKLAPKLTRKHVNPQNHEKMNTKLAFQLFSGTVADALTFLKDNHEPGFEDCEPTIQFCRRLNQLSDILNSNSFLNALRPDSEQQQALEDFLIYLDLWESCAEPEFFLTKSTTEGLKATIHTTLDLLKYCTEKVGFKYLMTTRINQDPLEHFFGLLRASGGANNSAESLQIAQIFRLMSLYSLVKPPVGSNVSGGNMLDTLIHNTEDVLSCNTSDKKNLAKKEVDLRLDQALNVDIGSAVGFQFKDNEQAFAYVCGFIARKFKSENCSNCVQTIVGNGVESFNTFIILRSRGHLTFPSKNLVTLLQEVETIISEDLKKEIERNTLLNISEKIGVTKIHNMVGCEEHKSEITKKIVFSFLMTRMAFSCQKEARKRHAERTSAKKYSKLAKLV